MRRSRAGAPSRAQAEPGWGSRPPSTSGPYPHALDSSAVAAVPAASSPLDAPSTPMPALPYDSHSATGFRQRPPSASRRRPESARGPSTALAMGLGSAGLPRGEAAGGALRPRALLVNGLAPAAGGDAATGATPRMGYKQLLRRHEMRLIKSGMGCC